MATYGGQNIGARRLERMGAGLKAAVIMGSVYAVLAFLALCCFGNPIIRIFVDGDQTQIIRQARQYLLVNAAFYYSPGFCKCGTVFDSGNGLYKKGGAGRSM